MVLSVFFLDIEKESIVTRLIDYIRFVLYSLIRSKYNLSKQRRQWQQNKRWKKNVEEEEE